MRTVKEVMSSPVKTVESSLSAQEVISFFKVHNISGAPVVNEKGFAVGLVSRSDLVSGTDLSDSTVADLMTPFVFEISPDEELLTVAKSMVDAKIHRVVVTEEGLPVGIVTSLDLVKDYVEQMSS